MCCCCCCLTWSTVEWCACVRILKFPSRLTPPLPPYRFMDFLKFYSNLRLFRLLSPPPTTVPRSGSPWSQRLTAVAAVVAAVSTASAADVLNYNTCDGNALTHVTHTRARAYKDFTGMKCHLVQLRHSDSVRARTRIFSNDARSALRSLRKSCYCGILKTISGSFNWSRSLLWKLFCLCPSVASWQLCSLTRVSYHLLNYSQNSTL